VSDRPARIAQLKAEIAERQAELVRLSLEYAAELAGLSGDERERFVSRGLTMQSQSDTLDPMDATETANARMSRARISKTARKHPFVQAFMERGETVAQAAEKLGYPRTSVQSWYRVDDNARPIPRAAAQKALRLYGVPLTAWQKLGE